MSDKTAKTIMLGHRTAQSVCRVMSARSRVSLSKTFLTGGLRGLAQASTTKEKPFDKILIANRGEIAIRVIRTARRLGVKTVAVYSDVDARAKHVQEADEAYCIGPAPSKDSYLVMEKVLEVAKKSGAQAIHPGYGFLSENAKFVDMVEAAGIAFIGPSSGPMHDMGDKINSKRIAKEAGCFVIPGFDGEVATADDAARLAKEVGFPVMIKASAGGGGKGMRVAYDEDEVREGFALSKAEAAASFGDDRMLIERFIEDPHHIEIQVIADSHGNVAAFPERECSVQRRNQKVVEESPSCLLLPETRKKMQEQAMMLCRATNYRSAGTVEMLADGKQNFYFLEMNTRLQVEHPVTEMVSGEDLVEHMLWVAAGKKLPDRFIEQPHVPSRGWSMESRVYAEDPLRKFLPSTGPLISYKEPSANFNCGEEFDPATNQDTCRVDSGVYEGGTISMFYDPMISKVITHGPDRNSAIKAMERALDEYVVEGLGNNLCFLRSVLRNDAFRSGNYGTNFIAEQYPNGFSGVGLVEYETRRVAAVGAMMHWLRLDKASVEENAFVVTLPPVVEGDSERCFAAAISIGAEDDDDDEDIDFFDEVLVQDHHDGVTVRLWDLNEVTKPPSESQNLHFASYPINLSDFNWMSGSKLLTVRFNEDGLKLENDIASGEDEPLQFEGRNGASIKLRYRGAQREVIVRSPREHHLSGHMLEPEVKDMSKFLVSPMPGTLISCSVQEGDLVEEGQALAVVEAMKMQNVLRAEKATRVAKVHCVEGQNLKVDQIIVEFDEI